MKVTKNLFTGRAVTSKNIELAEKIIETLGLDIEMANTFEIDVFDNVSLKVTITGTEEDIEKLFIVGKTNQQ